MVISVWSMLKRNRLFMNSIYLMLATAVTALAGFVFWVVVARSYDTATVGVATSLLSLSSLIALLSLAGFDTTLVKFLPSAGERQNDHINTAMAVVALLSLVISAGFVVGLGWSHSSLSFLTSNLWYGLSFMIFNCFAALNTLTNAVFLAYRRTWYVLLINLGFGSLKLVLPLLVTDGGPMTIFTLAGFSQVVGFGLSIWLLRRQFGFGWSRHWHVDILRLVRRYSTVVYVASILNLLPPTILPLLIMQKIGPAATAYYYMAFTIATMLFTVAYSLMQSAFAEAAYDQQSVRLHLQKAGYLALICLVPAILILLLGSSLIMAIFGANYARSGADLLRLFSVSAGLVAVYSGLAVISKLTKQLRGLLIMNIIYASSIIGVSYSLISRWGLNAVGIGWLVGNSLAVMVGLAVLKLIPWRGPRLEP